MKIALLGATGPSGLQVIAEALEQELEVLALVRNPEKITTEHKNLKVIKVDIFKEDDLVDHFRAVDVVLSCLGCRPSFFGWTTITFYTDTVKPIVAAMRKAGKKRFVCMTAWCTVYSAENPWFIEWILKPIVLGAALHNMSEMEQYLADECSDIDFTAVRPPGLGNGPSSGKEIEAVEGQFVPNKRGPLSRRDVAKFLIQCAKDGLWIKKCVAVAV